MKKYFIILGAAVLTIAFISMAYGQTVKDAEVKFRQAREAYVAAQEELSDAQIDSFLTVGKAEKEKAVSRLSNAKAELKRTKKAYKEALSVLHKAELTRDAKIDRSPWN